MASTDVGGVTALNAFWQLARPRTCLVSVLAYVFGLEVSRADWGTRAVLGTVVALIVPAVANLHNAYTDVAEDGRNLPGRAALVAAAQVRRMRVAVAAGIAAIVVLTAYMGLAPLVIGVVGSVLLLAYSALRIRAKARPVLGLMVFSMVVTIPFLAGAMVTEEWATWRSPGNPTVVVWFFYLMLFFVAKGFVKNVPDFRGDADAGLRTSATVMGTPRRAALAAVIVTWIAYLALVPVVFAAPAVQTPSIILAWAAVACWHVCGLLRSQQPVDLNHVLKRDMVVSVVTLAVLAVTARWSMEAVLATIGCLLILLVADLVGKDSRATVHLVPAELKIPEQ